MFLVKENPNNIKIRKMGSKSMEWMVDFVRVFTWDLTFVMCMPYNTVLGALHM